MAEMTADRFLVLQPDIQIALHTKLQAIRDKYLYEAMKATIEDKDFKLEALETELKKYVPEKFRKKLTAVSVSANLFFPVPCLLNRNPYLLGYYRLLLGFSRKEFYEQGPFRQFIRMEDKGEIPAAVKDKLAGFCKSLCESVAALVEAISPSALSIVNELIIMSLGAQFRGGSNVGVGQVATKVFKDFLNTLLAAYRPQQSSRDKNTFTFANDSQRTVVVKVGADPDVKFTQQIGAAEHKILAIEIKGGKDASNIWNRIGEAEKSHETARKAGFNERWTVTRVDVTMKSRIETHVHP